jgi:hypothetical protein
MKHRSAQHIRRAHQRVRDHILTGRLVRPSRCEWCGREGCAIEAAHEDYSRPLLVRWLCRSCHRRWDRAEPKSAGGWAGFVDPTFTAPLHGGAS